jgi:hypothetical protein
MPHIPTFRRQAERRLNKHGAAANFRSGACNSSFDN